MPIARSGFREAMRSLASWALTLGGTGLVTALTSAFAQATPSTLVAVAVSSAVLLMGGYGLFREHNPPPPDVDLRNRQSEKIERWRKAVESYSRHYPYSNRHESQLFQHTAEYAEMMRHLTDEERSQIEEQEHGHHTVRDTLYRALARLQEKWGLV